MAAPSDRTTGLTADVLRSIVSYDEATGIFRWLADGRGRFQRIGAIAGSQDDRPYPVLTIRGRTYYKHRLAWLYAHGRWPDEEIDHRRGDKQDLTDLREATRQQNARNQGPQSRNKAGYRGVAPTRNSKRFSAFFGLDGKTTYLGTFDTAEQAARAYDDKAARHYGAYARLNFPQATETPT